MKEVGFIGLGNIGLPASVNLLKRGFEVHGFDIRPNDLFAKAGGKPAASLSELGGLPVIIQSLPSAAALKSTIDGLLPTATAGQIIIDISSYPLKIKQAQASRLAARGVVMLDCEVSGLPHQVSDRTAVLFKAGDQEATNRCAGIFDALADRHYYLGAFGAASKMKAVANVMVCVHDLMAAEALNFGRALGLDPAQMVEVLRPSAAGSMTFANKAPLMLSRKFSEGRGPFSHMFGHLDRAYDYASEAQVLAATPLLLTVREVFALARKQGRHEQDIAAVIEILETLPGKQQQ